MTPIAESPAPGRRPAAAGFSLIEVLVAMGLLAIGMSGILALFSGAVALQREAVERMDMDILQSGVRAQVEDDLATRLGGARPGGFRDLEGAEFPVPGEPRYRYRVHVEEVQDDPAPPLLLCRIEILARWRGKEQVGDLGYMAVAPRPNQDALIRSLIAGDEAHRPAR